MLSVLYVGFRRGGETGGVKKCSKMCVHKSDRTVSCGECCGRMVGWSGL